eukprot:14010938-Alexandrium_andersonii.AAC.1
MPSWPACPLTSGTSASGSPGASTLVSTRGTTCARRPSSSSSWLTELSPRCSRMGSGSLASTRAWRTG